MESVNLYFTIKPYKKISTASTPHNWGRWIGSKSSSKFRWGGLSYFEGHLMSLWIGGTKNTFRKDALSSPISDSYCWNICSSFEKRWLREGEYIFRTCLCQRTCICIVALDLLISVLYSIYRTCKKYRFNWSTGCLFNFSNLLSDFVSFQEEWKRHWIFFFFN